MSFFKTSRRIIVDWTMQRKITSLSFKVNGFFDTEEKPVKTTMPVQADTMAEAAKRDFSECYSTDKYHTIPKDCVNDMRLHKCYKDVNFEIGQVNYECLHAPDTKARHVTTIKHSFNVKWHAKRGDINRRGPRHPGGRLGKMDAATEAGFFHKADRDKLLELKNTLKDKEKAPDVPRKSD